MKKQFIGVAVVAAAAVLGTACSNKPAEQAEKSKMQLNVEEYTEVELKSPLVNQLSENEKALMPIFVEIAQIMDELFWKQTFGDKSEMEKISDMWTKEFFKINYGAWNRLDSMKSFVENYGEKPLGCHYYPTDITKEEYEAYNEPNKGSLYTVLRRNDDGTLKTVWYRDEYRKEIEKVCELLDKAIQLAEDNGLKNYLTERKKAFQTDDYFASDMAWMDMKESRMDFVVGPIENYDDKLNEAKASYEAFILLKDEKRSADLAKFVAMLPSLQRELPGDDKYKTFVPGTSSDLNVYDVVYYAGDCNAGSKTIAINLPNDDKVQKLKGARRLQLRNAMQAKFDKILLPISELILDPSQKKHVKFDAFFWNVTFHEVAHGLGIKETINGKGSVDDAMQTEKTSWEEAKADILGLFLSCNLIEKGEITNITVEDAITTYIAGILRSVRFGISSSHGKANMMCYNYMEKEGAFSRNEKGIYTIDFNKAKQAVSSWGALILEVQGEGNFAFAETFRNENGNIGEQLQADLDKINNSGIPRDIRFVQGLETLGLK
ncbi:MAG: Zn-dependent hydrolase [Bacteroidales bacterium]|nr:Zn-dependent hydrolase [Bacteroidales bacterium]